MLNQESPIIDFYPTHFETDLNGKVQEWEAVVLIPFIDEVRCLWHVVDVSLRQSLRNDIQTLRQTD